MPPLFWPALIEERNILCMNLEQGSESFSLKLLQHEVQDI
jgi:hypothetical protein